MIINDEKEEYMKMTDELNENMKTLTNEYNELVSI